MLFLERKTSSFIKIYEKLFYISSPKIFNKNNKIFKKSISSFNKKQCLKAQEHTRICRILSTKKQVKFRLKLKFQLHVPFY